MCSFGRQPVGHRCQHAAFALEHGQFCHRRVLAAHRAFAVHLEQEVVRRDVPAAEHRMAGALRLQVIVIVRVELRLSGLDAHHAGGQRAGHFLQVGRRGGRAAVARREHVEVAVVCRPDGLVVLRAVAPAGEAYFPGAGDDGCFVERVAAVDGHECAVGILRGGICPAV